MRLFHVVNIAQTLLGKPDQVPVSMLEMLAEKSPRFLRGVSAIPCNQWDKEIAEKYCVKPAGSEKKRASRTTIGELMKIPLEPEKTFAFKPNKFASQLPLVGYLPYVPGALIALVLKLSPVLVMYGAILSNALIVIGLGYYTLLLLPILRWPVFYLLLAPTVMMTRVMVMPDALTIDLCFFTLALCLELKASGRVLTRNQQVGIVALSTVVGLIKASYFLVPMIFFIVPTACFKSFRNKMTVVSIAVLCSIFAAVAWGVYALEEYYPSHILNNAGHSVLSDKVMFVLQHPIESFEAMWSIFDNKEEMTWKLNSMLTWRIYWLSNPLEAFILFSPLLLVAFCGDGVKKPKLILTYSDRFISLAIFIICQAVIYTVFFLHKPSPVFHADHPHEFFVKLQKNVYGRYVIPFLPLLLLAIYDGLPGKAGLKKWLYPLLVIIMLICLGCLNYGQLDPAFRNTLSQMQ